MTTSYDVRELKIAPYSQSTAIVGSSSSSNVVMYLSVNTSAVSLIQAVAIPTGSAPEGLTYIDDTRIIVDISSSGMYLFALTPTAIVYQSEVNTNSNFYGLTFFPGSTTEGLVGSRASNYYYRFSFKVNTVTVDTT
jgi:hypothetical protein